MAVRGGIFKMHWHWLIVIYLFLGGLGAGAYLTSFAAEKGWLGKDSSLSRAGYFIAAPVVAFGTVLLVFDLGQGLHKPWLLIRLLSNFSSVMTWGVYILSAFIMVGLLKGYFAFIKKSAPKLLSWAGAILALATGAYTGLLLSVVEAVPFWNSGLMPVLFVTSALSTGLSVTSLLAPWLEKGNFKEGREGEAHIYLIGAELIIVAIFFGMMNSGVYGAVGQESAELLISGVYALIFWGYFIGLGLLFPLVVFMIPYLRSKQAVKQLAKGPSVAEREVAATVQKEHHNSYLTIATDISVIIGGFALRAIIILAALPIWDGITIP
ncbi:MAG: oxidoreductase [Gracilibacter sp. BRH_c7a]|nr:MAG: oxidoreductase [Gracilibacter sp. BRH_c7a]